MDAHRSRASHVSEPSTEGIRKTQCRARPGWQSDIASGLPGVAGTARCRQAWPRGTRARPALTISEKKSEIQVCVSHFPFSNVRREV